MEPLAQQVEHRAEPELKRLRWALGIYGVLSIAFAVVLLVWPEISLFALTILFGVYAILNGITGLWAAAGGSNKKERGWLIVASLLNIAVGVVVFVWPNISELALLYVIGAYAIAFGIILMGGAFWLPMSSTGKFAFLLWGFVASLFGIVMFANPSDGALVLLSLIAAFSLVLGVAELVLAIDGKRQLEKRLNRYTKGPEPQVTH